MKSPAFRFYPADFWGSPDVQAMELHEVGAYVALLSVAWQSERHGYLADDNDRLRRWARMTREQWKESSALLLSKFPVVEPGFRANARLVHEANKQATFADSQRRKAEKRWGNTEPKPEQCRGDAGASTANAGGMPSVSVSVSDFQGKILSPPLASELADFAPEKPARDEDAKDVVRHVFGYFLEKTGRSEAQYALTDKRMQAGLRAHRVCLKRCGGDPEKAQHAMAAAVDGLIANDWLMGRDAKSKKRYTEWTDHVFKNVETIEKRWQDGGFNPDV